MGGILGWECEFLPRIIQQMDRPSSRNPCPSYTAGYEGHMSIKWKTVGGNGQLDLFAKHTQNFGGRGGGACELGLKETGNSLSRNFSYRAVGPPPVFYSSIIVYITIGGESAVHKPAPLKIRTTNMTCPVPIFFCSLSGGEIRWCSKKKSATKHRLWDQIQYQNSPTRQSANIIK